MRAVVLRATTIAVAITCLCAGTARGQGPIAGTVGDEFLQKVDEATSQNLSINPADLDFAVDSFFDVFVELVLREGLPQGVEIPSLVQPGSMVGPLPSDVVTETIREMGPELFDAMPPLRVNVANTDIVVPIAPGAAVYKWGPAGRWSRGPHRFDIHTWARVHQWIRASIYATNIVWTVFKPGRYSTDCIYLNVHSNGGMTVELANLGPLEPLVTDPTGTVVPITTAYALSRYIATQMNEVFWGQTTNGAPIVLDWVPDGAAGSIDVPPHFFFKLWNYIEVGTGVAPGTYGTPDGPSAVLTVMAQI